MVSNRGRKGTLLSAALRRPPMEAVPLIGASGVGGRYFGFLLEGGGGDR